LAEAPPIHTAAYRGDAAEVRGLLAAGVNPDERNDYHASTPLCVARTPEVAKLLIDAKANVNAVNKNQMTPLHYAKDAKIAQMLVHAGATLECRNFHGETPLDYARVSFGADAYSDVHVANLLEATQIARFTSDPLRLAVEVPEERPASSSSSSMPLVRPAPHTPPSYDFMPRHASMPYASRHGNMYYSRYGPAGIW
jgi:hypothetical protein